jgi:Ca-activated chloride channel family protein
MNFAEFHFLRPWCLLALFPLALFLVLLIKNKYSRGNWNAVCDAELLPFILTDKPQVKSRSALLGGGLASLLSIIALAGPTWERLPSPAFRNDAALVIALDLSASMDASDIKPSRLARARYKIDDLLKQRKDGQTALLVYSGDVFTVTPLTSDTATISSQLQALTTDIMPSPGDNTGAAIRKAVDLLNQAGVVQGHILLVTDAVDADTTKSAAQWLGANRLSVLAVGTADGAPIKMNGGSFLKDAQGNIILARLDADALVALARQGKGVYQLVTAGDEDVNALSKVFNAVGDKADKNQDTNRLLQQWDEKGPWLLLLVLPWAALRFRKGLLFWCGLCLLPLPRESQALDWQSLWQNPNQQAVQAFNQQQYPQAADEFQNPDWRAAAQYKAGQYQQAAETLKNAQTADEHYNRGNALAQAGQLQEALQAYQQALKLDPGHQDAKYNKDLVEKKLQEQQKQNKQQNNHQDKDQQKDKDKQQEKDQQKSEQDKSQQEQNLQQDQSGQQNQQSEPKDAQKSAEQNKSEQQKEQAQNSASQKAAEEQQKSDTEKHQQTEAEAKQEKDRQQAAEAKAEKKDQQTNGKPTQENLKSEQDEVDRADEKLLKRIPDEPTNLLKRKFQYQYSQRGRNAPSAPGW